MSGKSAVITEHKPHLQCQSAWKGTGGNERVDRKSLECPRDYRRLPKTTDYRRLPICVVSNESVVNPTTTITTTTTTTTLVNTSECVARQHDNHVVFPLKVIIQSQFSSHKNSRDVTCDNTFRL